MQVFDSKIKFQQLLLKKAALNNNLLITLFVFNYVGLDVLPFLQICLL